MVKRRKCSINGKRWKRNVPKSTSYRASKCTEFTLLITSLTFPEHSKATSKDSQFSSIHFGTDTRSWRSQWHIFAVSAFLGHAPNRSVPGFLAYGGKTCDKTRTNRRVNHLFQLCQCFCCLLVCNTLLWIKSFRPIPIIAGL